MPVCLTPRTDMSLANLIKLSRQGAYVIKTPHVGNIYPNNLAIASLGIPLVLVDQTIGSRDTNFHPHLLIAGGEQETVADADKLTARSRVTATSKHYPARFSCGASLAQAHTQSLRDALAHARVQTMSERTREHVDLMSAYLELMTRAALRCGNVPSRRMAMFTPCAIPRIRGNTSFNKASTVFLASIPAGSF